MTLATNKPKHYDGSYINIVTWNVQALIKDTVDDTMFLSCVNNNDVIILTETWLQGEMDILPNKYFNFHNIRVNSKKSRGRPSGGISVLIRKDLYSNSNQNIKKIQVLKSTDFSVWVKLNKIFFGLEKDVFLGAIYIPPKNSTYYNSHIGGCPFDELEKDISKFSGDGAIILAGDFNARTANKLELVHREPHFTKMSDEVMSDRCVTILETVGRAKRNSQDSVVNSFGNKLLDICGKFDICILNGRTLGDLSGNFTSFQRMGRSVVDYFIASEHLVPHIHTLQVSPPNNVSDHAFVAMNTVIENLINHQVWKV